MNDKIKKIIMYIVFAIILFCAGLFTERCRCNRDISNSRELQQQLEIVEQREQQAIRELEIANGKLREANNSIEKCEGILGECQSRIGNVESSLDGIAIWIDIYEETIRRLSEQLEFGNDSVGK